MNCVYEVIKKCDKTVDTILLIGFLIFILIGGYGVYDSYLVYLHANDTSILKYKPKDNNLQDNKISGDMVAWLTMDKTNIDYPVMQGKTNDEYLNKNPYGEYALSGSIFLDSSNSKKFDDGYSLIYGHHMENKGMFGSLDDYTNEKFLAKHKKGTLIIEGKSLKLHLFAVLSIQATNDYVFNPKAHHKEEVINEMKKYASFWDESADIAEKQIIALSTCKSPENDFRTVVVTYAD